MHIDTNVILGYLVDDRYSESVESLLKGERELILLDIVFAEVVWTLKSFYKWRKEKIVNALSSLIQLGSINANKVVLLRSLDIYSNHKIKYTDAYIAAVMLEKKASKIYSFDREFEKVDGIKRLEPESS